MSLKICTIFLLVTSIFSWILWFFILQNFSPNEANGFIFLLFYFSLFISLVSTLCTGMLISKILTKKMDNELETFKFAFLNSSLISTVFVVLLPLLHLKLINYWSALLILLIMLVTIFILSRNTNKKKYAK
jgi:hypothetical protein